MGSVENCSITLSSRSTGYPTDQTTLKTTAICDNPRSPTFLQIRFQMSGKSPPEPEAPKHIVSSHWWHFVGWHVWTVVSLTVTAVLMWLNFSQFAIGGELGRSPQSSANIIGALQLAIKAHELLIVASLITIARQMIIGNLLDGGIVLGLLGAESALTTPSFIFTGEYRQSLMFGLRSISKKGNTSVNRRVLWLAVFVFWACVLSSLAGPASGVLMIPRVDWHLFGERTYTPHIDNTYPNIMIGTGGAHDDTNVFEWPVELAPGLKYWQYYFENSSWNATLAEEDDFYHKFGDGGHAAHINTTGSYGRSLDDFWSGGTNVTCGMQAKSIEIQENTWEKFPIRMNETRKDWRAVKSTINVVALNGLVTCRAREKIPCATTVVSGNHSDPDWCYKSVEYSPSSGVLRTSRNLLLAADFGEANSRVWVTEGPRIAANSHYSDSIEVIFEAGPPENDTAQFDNIVSFNLTVCSFSGAFVAGIGTALGTHFTPEKIEYFNYALKPDGKHATHDIFCSTKTSLTVRMPSTANCGRISPVYTLIIYPIPHGREQSHHRITCWPPSGIRLEKQAVTIMDRRHCRPRWLLVGH